MKDIYMEINKMNKKSFEMREIASDEKVGFEKSKKIREEQTKLYNKLNFFKNFVKANQKLEIGE